jgi:hypothetical protein
MSNELHELPINTMVDGDSARLVDALRTINHALVGKAIPPSEVTKLADMLEKTARDFAALTEEKRERGFGVVNDRSESSVGSGYEYGAGKSLSYRPISGRCNAVAPPVKYFQASDHIIGKVTFGAAYEGPPGLVHGGYLAACLDELFGITATHSDIQEPCMTGTLKMIYRAPVPLHQEITYKGWHERDEGRKVFLKCAITAPEGQLLGEGEAIFLKIDPSIYAKMGG